MLLSSKHSTSSSTCFLTRLIPCILSFSFSSSASSRSTFLATFTSVSVSSCTEILQLLALNLQLAMTSFQSCKPSGCFSSTLPTGSPTLGVKMLLPLLIFAEIQQNSFAFTFNKSIDKLQHHISDDITSPCALFFFCPSVPFFPARSRILRDVQLNVNEGKVPTISHVKMFQFHM